MKVDQDERKREDQVIKVANLLIRKGPRGRVAWDELFTEVYGSVPLKGTDEERVQFEEKRKEVKSIIAEISMMFRVLIHPSFPPGSRESVWNLLVDEDELGVFARLVKKREQSIAEMRELEEKIRVSEEQSKESERRFGEELKALSEESERRDRLFKEKEKELHSAIRKACWDFLKSQDMEVNRRTVGHLLLAFHKVSGEFLSKMGDEGKERSE